MNISYIYNNEIIELELIHKKRKNITIKIDEVGNIKVLAPNEVKSEEVIEIVKNKSEWIIKKRNEIQCNITTLSKRQLKTGEYYMFLGKEYPLEIVHNNLAKKTVISFDGKKILIVTKIENENTLSYELEGWYRNETMTIIRNRINYYEGFFEDKVKGIKVKEQKRRWASCTYDNRLLFNWRLSMAPIEVIDYVVVHEMCHMKYKNHSKEYWKHVERVMPDYKKRHDWLKINGNNLYR